MADTPRPSIEESGFTAPETPPRNAVRGGPGFETPRVTFSPSCSSATLATPGSPEVGGYEHRCLDDHGSPVPEVPSLSEGQSASSRQDNINMASITTTLGEVEREPIQRLSAIPEVLRRPSTPTPTRRSQPRSSTSTPITRRRHDVASEKPPRDAFNDPGFQIALQDTKQAMSVLAGKLGGGSIHLDSSSTMSSLLKEAQELAQFSCANKRTVCFVGDMGTGEFKATSTWTGL